MKVAIVQERLDARRGGAETSTLEMAAALAALGQDVTLVARSEPGSDDAPPAAGVRVQRVPAAGASRAARTRAFVAAADDFCCGGAFDVVHAVTPCRSADVYQPRGGTYRETIKRSLALTPSAAGRAVRRFGKWLNRRQRDLLALETELLTRPDPPFVAGVSAYVCRHVLDAFPAYPRDRARVVFNGVDVVLLDDPRHARRTARDALGIPEPAPLILFVAHNFRLKGLRELLSAIARGLPDAQLVVAGRDRAAPYAAQARALGIAPRVRFLGPSADVRTLYAAADVLAHPTWYDPCSRVVLEALCHGLPVVTTRWNGASEIMQPPADGAVISEPGDVPALHEALRSVLKRRAERPPPSPERVAQLSMRRHARELVALYEDVRAARSARRVDVPVNQV